MIQAQSEAQINLYKEQQEQARIRIEGEMRQLQDKLSQKESEIRNSIADAERKSIEEINKIEGNIVITDIRKEMELHACQVMKAFPHDDVSIIRITTNREGIKEDPDEAIIDHFNVDFEFHNTKEKQSVPDWKDFVWCVTGINI